MDDLLIGSASVEEDLQNLHALFQCLQDSGVRCNLEKCCFTQLSVVYLGHTLPRNGISEGHKVNAIAKMLPPTNICAWYSFFPSVQFYSKSILNLSTLTKPLTCLTKKDMLLRWNAEKQVTFLSINDLLCKNTVLVLLILPYRSAFPVMFVMLELEWSVSQIQ